jgi:hypothetical protein
MIAFPSSHTNITSLDSSEVPATTFDQPTENMQDALPLLYQSGYLSIKDYDADIQSYHLSIPNQEVRTAQHALEQINARGYAKPYLSDGRRVVEIGIRFDADIYTVDEWVVECL